MMMIKNFLAKYGRHFWIISLAVTAYTAYDLFFDEGDLFSTVMLAACTYYFFLRGTGRLSKKDDTFVEWIIPMYKYHKQGDSYENTSIQIIIFSTTIIT